MVTKRDNQVDQNKVLYDNQVSLQKQLDEQNVLNCEQSQALEQLKLQQSKRVLPNSELDLNLMLTDTVWKDLSPALKDKLTKSYLIRKPDGSLEVTKEDMSALLGFYTRDLRLGNLSKIGGEVDFCDYHLNLANDFLKEGFIDPFLICLSRVASRLELSQSRGGFLRKRHGTFTSENKSETTEPAKRSLMGTKTKSE